MKAEDPLKDTAEAIAKKFPQIRPPKKDDPTAADNSNAALEKWLKENPRVNINIPDSPAQKNPDGSDPMAEYEAQKKRKAAEDLPANTFSQEKLLERIVISARSPVKARFFVSGSTLDTSLFANKFYTAFLLEGVNYQVNEKYQITETFSSNYLTIFGRRPTLMNISGTVYNELDHEWLSTLYNAYYSDLSASASLLNGSKIFLQYENVTAEVAILGVSFSESSMMPHSAKFTMQLAILSKIVFDTGSAA